jgi:predicted transcriptional regulator
MNDYLGMRIDPDLKEDLETIAKKQRRKLTNLVTLILEDYVILNLKKRKSIHGKSRK